MIIGAIRTDVLLFQRQVHQRIQSSKIYLSTQREIRVNGSIPHGGLGVTVSQYAEISRVFTSEDVSIFGRVTSDNNPLHKQWNIDERPTELQSHPLLGDLESDQNDETKIVVHGMLAASLFSCIFGTLVPGSVYLKQTLDFKLPIYVDDVVTGRVEVARVRHWSKIGGIIVKCDTKVLRRGKECILGEADVWLPGGFKGNKSNPL